MMNRRKLWREEDGGALVLFSLFLVVIVGIAGLVIDVGMVYSTRSHLKKTADAAVLSGAQELPNSNECVNKVVVDIISANKDMNSLKEISITKNNISSLKVSLEKEVPMKFLKLFNVNVIKVQVSSVAEILPMNSAIGAVPLGIDKSIPLEYMKEYTLKVDSGDSSYGNFGILALSGVGAKLYEQDLTYGYSNTIKVGDILTTQTGNIAGKTKNAVNYRINSSPYALNDTSHRDDPRIILILIYEPYNVSSNQLKEVKIDGFAYFYLKSPMTNNDTSITGYFIRRVGTGHGDSSLQDTGAYSIRLTE